MRKTALFGPLLTVTLSLVAAGVTATEFLRSSTRALQAKKCPKENPLDHPGEGKCLDGLSCGYGEETCCGKTYSSIVCDCYGGDWGCYNTDACFIPTCEQCPQEEPSTGGACTIPSDKTKTCEYGETVCCGETLPSLSCMCGDDGTWGCFAPGCPQPCPNEEPFDP